ELRDNTFSGSENEDANEHIEKVLEIFDLFNIPDVTQDQLLLRVFPITLIGAASRWLRNEPSGSITIWDILKGKFLSKYCPPTRGDFVLQRFLALGWHLEGIHVTWGHLEKKRMRLRTYTKSLKKYCLQNVETASVSI
ncbi:hypothetical protein Tco_0983199, partial [Tanacetum coccineum]